MEGLINSLSLQWDLWIGQFRAFFPSDKEDVADCYRLIEANGRDDLLMEKGGQAPTQLAACQDTRNGAIVACLRMIDAPVMKKVREKAAHYHFHYFAEDQLLKTAIFLDPAIDEEYQKTQAAPVLLSHCFIEVLKAGGQSIVMLCDSEYFPRYRRLGMRPVGPLRKSSDGRHRIPMIFLPDQEYLSMIHSPVLPLLRGIYFDQYRPLCQWYYQLVRENSELKIGSAFYADNNEEQEEHLAITEGLSAKGRKAFLQNAMVINCREGEELITENDGGKAFGVVRRGIVKVVIGNKTIVLLGEGDIFGEIAYVLHSKRTAQVIAASPKTEVVLFSESAINRLELEADRTAIWKNLARVLAQKIMLTNKLLE